MQSSRTYVSLLATKKYDAEELQQLIAPFSNTDQALETLHYFINYDLPMEYFAEVVTGIAQQLPAQSYEFFNNHPVPVNTVATTCRVLSELKRENLLTPENIVLTYSRALLPMFKFGVLKEYEIELTTDLFKLIISAKSPSQMGLAIYYLYSYECADADNLQALAAHTHPEEMQKALRYLAGNDHNITPEIRAALVNSSKPLSTAEGISVQHENPTISFDKIAGANNPYSYARAMNFFYTSSQQLHTTLLAVKPDLEVVLLQHEYPYEVVRVWDNFFTAGVAIEVWLQTTIDFISIESLYHFLEKLEELKLPLTEYQNNLFDRQWLSYVNSISDLKTLSVLLQKKIETPEQIIAIFKSEALNLKIIHKPEFFQMLPDLLPDDALTEIAYFYLSGIIYPPYPQGSKLSLYGKAPPLRGDNPDRVPLLLYKHLDKTDFDQFISYLCNSLNDTKPDFVLKCCIKLIGMQDRLPLESKNKLLTALFKLAKEKFDAQVYAALFNCIEKLMDYYTSDGLAIQLDDKIAECLHRYISHLIPATERAQELLKTMVRLKVHLSLEAKKAILLGLKRFDYHAIIFPMLYEPLRKMVAEKYLDEFVYHYDIEPHNIEGIVLYKDYFNEEKLTIKVQEKLTKITDGTRDMLDSSITDLGKLFVVLTPALFENVINQFILLLNSSDVAPSRAIKACESLLINLHLIPNARFAEVKNSMVAFFNRVRFKGFHKFALFEKLIPHTNENDWQKSIHTALTLIDTDIFDFYAIFTCIANFISVKQNEEIIKNVCGKLFNDKKALPEKIFGVIAAIKEIPDLEIQKLIIEKITLYMQTINPKYMSDFERFIAKQIQDISKTINTSHFRISIIEIFYNFLLRIDNNTGDYQNPNKIKFIYSILENLQGEEMVENMYKRAINEVGLARTAATSYLNQIYFKSPRDKREEVFLNLLKRSAISSNETSLKTFIAVQTKQEHNTTSIFLLAQINDPETSPQHKEYYHNILKVYFKVLEYDQQQNLLITWTHKDPMEMIKLRLISHKQHLINKKTAETLISTTEPTLPPLKPIKKLRPSSISNSSLALFKPPLKIPSKQQQTQPPIKSKTLSSISE